MKKESILVLVSALVFAGCFSDSRHHAAGSPLDSDAYRVEIEIPGEGSVVERFEMGVSVLNSLEDLDLNLVMEGNGAEPAVRLGGTGEVDIFVSVKSSSFLTISISERVFVTCSVSGFEDNERAGSVCRDVLLSEIEKQGRAI